MSLEVLIQRVWEIYDERLQFMSRQMSLLVGMMFLWLGLFGLGLLSLLLLMRFSSVVVLFPLEVWFLAGVLLCFVGFSWVVIGFVGLELTLLTLLMLLISSYIETFPLLLCLTCGVDLRL